ncbi:alpha/beta hydrolase [Corallococcus caeni]
MGCGASSSGPSFTRARSSRTRHIPEMIVVGVPNTTDRTRDLTPPFSRTERVDDGRRLSEVSPTAGHADTFLRFLTEELAPHVEARYRTQPYRILVGHSHGGLFAMHVLTHKPESFNAYVALSPSVHWNSAELVRTAPEALARPARRAAHALSLRTRIPSPWMRR